MALILMIEYEQHFQNTQQLNEARVGSENDALSRTRKPRRSDALAKRGLRGEVQVCDQLASVPKMDVHMQSSRLSFVTVLIQQAGELACWTTATPPRS
jgi:hypothetical protein